MLQIEAATNVTSWIVEYPKTDYEAGDYTVTVVLQKRFYLLWIEVDRASSTFQLTGKWDKTHIA